MSQYGAHGLRPAGLERVRRSSAHYYTGTALGTTDPDRKVRVLLVARRRRSARITGARQAGSRRLDPTTTYTIKRRGLSQVDLSASGKRLATFTAPLQVAGEGGVTTLGGPRQLPRRARVRADRLQRPRGRQRRRPRRLPAGRRARRVARVVAGRGAEGAGDRRPHLRDHDGQERRRSTTTPTRARRSTRASGSRPRRPTPPSPPRAARSSPTRASRSSPTSSRPRAGAPRRSRTRRWAPSRSRG